MYSSGDGDFPLFVIGTSSLIPHSNFLIRHSLVGWGLTPRVSYDYNKRTFAEYGEQDCRR